MNTGLKIWMLCCLAGLSIVSCKSDYEKMVDRELSSGLRNDTLFLGIKLGMGQKDFFEHCWEMNKQGYFIQGSGNTSVKYEMSELKHRAHMNFYPDFHDGKIYRMPVLFEYKNWSPWNQELSADTLQLDVLRFLEQQYGPGFIRLENETGQVVYTKVDGNRRIVLGKDPNDKVRVVFSDLPLEQSLNNKDLKQ